MGMDRFPGGWLGADSASTSDPAPIAGQLGNDCVFAPLLSAEVPAVTDQVTVASALARAAGSPLYVTSPGRIPERAPPCGQDLAAEDGELLDWAVEEATRWARQADDGMLSARRTVNDVLRTIAANDVDTVVLPRDAAGGPLAGAASERIARRAEADTLVVNGRPGFDGGPSILLPISGGPHSGLAVDVARRVAADADAWIDVLHVVETGASDRRRDRAQDYVSAAAQRIERPETTSTWVLEADDPTDAIIEQSRYYSLTVVGAPTKGRLRRFIHGSTNKSIRSNAQSVVLSARNNTGGESLLPG